MCFTSVSKIFIRISCFSKTKRFTVIAYRNYEIQPFLKFIVDKSKLFRLLTLLPTKGYAYSLGSVCNTNKITDTREKQSSGLQRRELLEVKYLTHLSK